MKNNCLTRREFFQFAIVTTGALLIPTGQFAFGQEWLFPDKTLRLNPGFRVIDISENEIDLYTQKKDGPDKKLRFKDLEADLLRNIEKGGDMDALIEASIPKYHTSSDNVRYQIRQFLKQFENDKIIYHGEKILVKITEITENGQ